MKRPVAVRIGISLLLLALILRAAALIVTITQTVRHQSTTISAGGDAASLLIYAAFVYGMAQRRNWVRLLFAFLAVTSAIMALGFGFIGGYGGLGGAQLALVVLVGAGVVCLFSPSAAAWYRGSDRSSLTSA